MDRPFRILAAVDFSHTARAAFGYALALGGHEHGVELRAVHAVPASEPYRWRGSERAALLAQLRRDADTAGAGFSTRIQQGDPAEIILLHASAWQPDLIVVGTRQDAGWQRLRAGSVAERVVRDAVPPVLTVPVGLEPGRTPRLERIAVAVDFGAASARAIEHALALARGTNARVSLMHVIPGYSADDMPRHLYRSGAVEYQRQMTRDAWRRLQAAGGGIHARVIVGDTHDGLVKTAAEMNADVIVVGVSTRGAWSRAVRGTTAGRLLKSAKVPLLTVGANAGPPLPAAGAVALAA